MFRLINYKYWIITLNSPSAQPLNMTFGSIYQLCIKALRSFMNLYLMSIVDIVIACNQRDES